MLILTRIIPYAQSASVFLWLYLTAVLPKIWYVFTALLLVITAIFLLKLFKWQYQNKEFLLFSLCLFLFIGSANAFLFFLEGELARFVLILFTALLSGFYCYNIFLYLYNQKSYIPYSLQNTSAYLNVVSFFLLMASFYSLELFFSLPFYLVILLVFLLTFILLAQTIWVNKISLKKEIFFLVIVGLIMAELFWAIHYLPTSFYVNALISAIAYYLVINISLNYLSGKKDAKSIKRTLFIGLIMLILVLATAQWT